MSEKLDGFDELDELNDRLIIAPASKPQEFALNSTSDITLYGGK